ncbi:hypothetical protein JYT29_01405 [Nitrospina gracilis]|nr:hypothetical protein [Nitrospina gracilis]
MTSTLKLYCKATKNSQVNNKKNSEILKAALKQMARQEDNKLERIISFVQKSQIPWQDEMIRELCYMGDKHFYKALEYHPGWQLVVKWQSLQTLFKVQQGNFADLMFALDKFHEFSQDKEFFNRKNESINDSVCFAVNRHMFNFAMVSDAIADISKPGKKKTNPFCLLKDYTNQFDKYYSSNPTYQFVRCLRNSLAHEQFFHAGYNIQIITPERLTDFALNSSSLLKSKFFKGSAKDFIKNSGEKVSLRVVFDEYFKMVTAFYNWLEAMVEGNEAFNDYREILIERKRTGTRVTWGIFLQQLEPKQADLYDYLEDNFTKEELAIIEKLPHRSKEQADKIIDIYDKDKACTEEIRNRLYKLFKVV